MSESETKKPDEFPAGVRVLAVDDDFVVLRTVERLLIKCGYKVTVAHHALEALQLLRANKEGYDLVISDVNMPDMDGFKLLEIVGLEMDLPVIMLSVDCDVKSVMKGIMHGAVDYLVKPVRLEELQLIWKHIAKRSFNKRKDCNEHGNKLDNSRPEDVRETHHAKKCKERSRHDKTEDDSEDSDEEMASHKKPRVNWTAELHAKFINSVNRLGVDRAVPKKILDIMNVPGLTRENVASHLQKYRKGLKKNATGHGQHYLGSSGTSASNASSFLVNRSGVNVHKSVSLPPSCFPVHQPYGSHARLSSTWLPRPLSRPINLCRQYATCSQASLSSTQHQGFTTGSEPTQILSNHLSYADRSNKLNCYEWRPCQDPWRNDGDSGSNSITQLGFGLDHQATDMFSSNYLLDDHFTNEFDLILEGDQNQLSSCPVLDAESEAHTNQDILDIQGTIFEDHRESSPSDFTINPVEHFSTETTFAFNLGEDVDDLHAALKQFQR